MYRQCICLLPHECIFPRLKWALLGLSLFFCLNIVFCCRMAIFYWNVTSAHQQVSKGMSCWRWNLNYLFIYFYLPFLLQGKLNCHDLILRVWAQTQKTVSYTTTGTRLMPSSQCSHSLHFYSKEGPSEVKVPLVSGILTPSHVLLMSLQSKGCTNPYVTNCHNWLHTLIICNLPMSLLSFHCLCCQSILPHTEW